MANISELIREKCIHKYDFIFWYNPNGINQAIKFRDILRIVSNYFSLQTLMELERIQIIFVVKGTLEHAREIEEADRINMARDQKTEWNGALIGLFENKIKSMINDNPRILTTRENEELLNLHATVNRCLCSVNLKPFEEYMRELSTGKFLMKMIQLQNILPIDECVVCCETTHIFHMLAMKKNNPDISKNNLHIFNMTICCE
jgi:hypothetical protein